MDMKVNSNLVKTLRRKKLFSQEELATACDVSVRTIQRLEGESHASPETVKALASVLEIDAQQLLAAAEPDAYINVQLGYVVILIFFAIAIVMVMLFEQGRFSDTVFLISLLFIVVACSLFSTLTTKIGHAQLECHFSLGFLRRSIPLAQIQSAKIIRTKWWWGFGIRLTPYGWLYNAAGLDAVALRLKDGRKLLIGTDEPNEFLAAIKSYIAN